MTKRRKPVHYRIVFLANSNPQPWPCHFCGLDVTVEDDLVIHHLDEDHENNDFENLVPAHGPCHVSWHGTNSSAETVALRTKNLSGPKSPEHRRKIGEAHRGMKRSQITRQNLRKAAKRQWESPQARANHRAACTQHYSCGECEYVSNASALGKHQIKTGHVGKEATG